MTAHDLDTISSLLTDSSVAAVDAARIASAILHGECLTDPQQFQLWALAEMADNTARMASLCRDCVEALRGTLGPAGVNGTADVVAGSR
jgi:hypothetical protein